MTLADALTSLLAGLRLRNYSASTLCNYREQLQRFGEWLSADLACDLRRVSKSDIDTYQLYVRSEPISADTQALRLRAVKRLFDCLTDAGQLLLHPAEHIVELRRKDRLPKAVLTLKQMNQLLAAPDTGTALGLRDRALLEVLYGTAIRVGELERVLVTDLSLSQQILTIREGKGGKDRMVPLGSAALLWTKRYLDEVRPALAKNCPYERALFLVRPGRRLRQTHIRVILRRYKDHCHLKKSVTPHALRHACATHLLQAGADIRMIQELLGHARLDSTALYTRVVPVDVKAMHSRYHPSEHPHATD